MEAPISTGRPHAVKLNADNQTRVVAERAGDPPDLIEPPVRAIETGCRAMPPTQPKVKLVPAKPAVAAMTSTAPGQHSLESRKASPEPAGFRSSRRQPMAHLQ
jgi:hypothetical protein